MDLSEKLYKLRNEKGITQLKLADQLHVSRQTVSKWEVGEGIPSVDSLKRLSDFYNVPIEYLVTTSLEPQDYETNTKIVELEQLPEEKDSSNVDNSFGYEENKRYHNNLKIKHFVLMIIGAVIIIVILTLVAGKNGKPTEESDLNEIRKTEVSVLPGDSFNFTM